MKSAQDFTDIPFMRIWETQAGFAGGTLLVGHLDVPVESTLPYQSFRRDISLFAEIQSGCMVRG
ncbi:MAG: hypothetical protein ACYSU5_25975 [Planctomycetota bacterium]